MKRTTPMRFFAIAIILVVFEAGNSGRADDEFLEQSRMEWVDSLEKKCARGADEQAVRKVMAGKYRDVGSERTEGENRFLLFLVDDYHQVELAFDPANKLISRPRIAPKCQWLRSPDGWVVSVPSQAEREKQAKAAKLAVQYLAERTRCDRDVLSPYCRRSVKTATWDVGVTIKSLDVDTPIYLLEVTDDGRVNEKVPIERETKR